MAPRKACKAVVAATALTPHMARASSAQDCMAVLARMRDATSLAGALQRTGQAAVLHGPDPFTVPAPAGQAVTGVPADIRNDVFVVPAVESDHVVDRKCTPAADLRVQSLAAFTTCNGDELRLERGTDGGWGIKPQGRVVRADITCSNGVIHVADTALIACGDGPLLEAEGVMPMSLLDGGSHA
jgi:uncharacterized surface protein with fasciclin (FAS1) repeats